MRGRGIGRSLAVWVVLALLAAPDAAQKSADTLRVAWRDAVANLDPYYNQQRTGLILAHHLFDGLVHRDPETFTLRPLLATAWRYVDDTTLEFELRRGVTFHDGSPFTADDVVYTVATILADPDLSVPSNFAWLEGAEKVDTHRVRLKLKRVFPAAIEYVAMVLPIWPQAREAMGARAFAEAPIGAGPYRLAGSEDGHRRLLLERFEGYYPDSPKGRPAIAEQPCPRHNTNFLISGLDHLAGSGVVARSECVVQYSCRVQQCAIQRNSIVALRIVALLCEYHTACFVIYCQCGCSSLRQMESDERLVDERVRLVLIQLEAYSRNRLTVEAKRYIQTVVRRIVTLCLRDPARYAHHLAQLACLRSPERYCKCVLAVN